MSAPALHRHVTYSGHVGDGAAVSGALAAPMDAEPIELVTARMPPGQLHALTFVAVKCDCRFYRDAATRVIERAAVESTPAEAPAAPGDGMAAVIRRHAAVRP